MLFNSYQFLFFFLIVFSLYYCLSYRKQNWLLLIASYVFYGAWDYRFLSLIFLSTIIDFYTGRKIYDSSDSKVRKKFLFISCFFNLGILGFFKYFNFFVESGESFFNLIGFTFITPRLDIVLPVGISFYTFQTMSYTIDIYRNKQKAISNFFDFALFVSFFPQLVAGPIERSSNLLPQLTKERKVSLKLLREGAWLITYGLFKKCVIADNLALLVDKAFDPSSHSTGIICLIALYAFAFQIYCDFSGYSDIARGLAKLMGIELMVNFNIPYLSKTPSEFWKRWHISLSSWLRDYLYIPLGGNRKGPGRTMVNLILTMGLGGLWHGAAWNFILWGLYHGILLAVYKFFADEKFFNKVPSWVSQVFFFHLVCLGWLFFRATSMNQICIFLQEILFYHSWNFDIAYMLFELMIFVIPFWMLEMWLNNCDDPWEKRGWNWGLGPAVVTVIWILIFILPPLEGKNFIYFQF